MTSIPSVSDGLIERATSEWEPMEIQQRQKLSNFMGVAQFRRQG